MLMLIALGFKARSGKDLVGNYLVRRYEFERLAFADSLKNAAKEIFGFTDEQVHGSKKEIVDPYWNMTPRSVLQKMGSDCLRDHFDKDIWIKSVHRKILQNPNKRYVICDCRYINEAAAVKSWGGVLVRLDRPQAGAGVGMDKHISETEMERFNQWDYIIDNKGQSIEELFKKVDKFMEIWHQ
jgi:hypothetical protein